jgi:hypothetical protein
VKGGAMPSESFTYVYGVEEVGETLNVDTIYMPDWYAEQPVIGEGIAAGWKRINTTSSGTKDVTAGGTANCPGVRMKYFQQGGDFDAGYYLSARDNSACNLYYGLYADQKLQLKPGKYVVSFNSVYWSEGAMSANATYNFNVMTLTYSPVFSALSLTSTGTMRESAAEQIKGSKAYEFNFAITKTASYVLNFEMAEGWNSVIVGNLLLTTAPSLADTYKGTFYRTMLAAKNIFKEGDTTAAAKKLKAAMEKYEGFTSTAPSVYTAATKELSAALRAYEAEVATSIQKTETELDRFDEGIYSLAGVRMGTDATALPKGIYLSNGKKFIIR